MRRALFRYWYVDAGSQVTIGETKEDYIDLGEVNVNLERALEIVECREAFKKRKVLRVKRVKEIPYNNANH